MFLRPALAIWSARAGENEPGRTGGAASAAARIRARSLSGGLTSSAASGRATAARLRRRANSLQLGHASMCARAISPSFASAASRTKAAMLLSSSSCSSHVIYEAPRLEIRVEFLECQPHPALDGAERHPDHLGDLPVAVATEVRELHGLPLLAWQACQRLSNDVALDRRGHFVPRVRARPGRLRVERYLPLLALVCAAT